MGCEVFWFCRVVKFRCVSIDGFSALKIGSHTHPNEVQTAGLTGLAGCPGRLPEDFHQRSFLGSFFDARFGSFFDAQWCHPGRLLEDFGRL